MQSPWESWWTVSHLLAPQQELFLWQEGLSSDIQFETGRGLKSKNYLFLTRIPCVVNVKKKKDFSSRYHPSVNVCAPRFLIWGLSYCPWAAGTWTHLLEGGRTWQTGPVLPVQEQKENRPAWFFFLIVSVLSLYWAGTCCSQLLRQPQLFQVHSLDVCWNGCEAAFHPSCKIIIALKMQRCVIPGDYPLVLEIISLSYLFPQLQLLNTYSSEMCLPAKALICFPECHSYRYAGEKHP